MKSETDTQSTQSILVRFIFHNLQTTHPSAICQFYTPSPSFWDFQQVLKEVLIYAECLLAYFTQSNWPQTTSAASGHRLYYTVAVTTTVNLHGFPPTCALG